MCGIGQINTQIAATICLRCGDTADFERKTNHILPKDQTALSCDENRRCIHIELSANIMKIHWLIADHSFSNYQN